MVGSSIHFEERTDTIIYALKQGFEGKKAIQDDSQVFSLNNWVNGAVAS